MWQGIKSRALVWRAVFAGPWKWLVTAPLAALGAFQAIRDEFFSPGLRDALRLPEWLPDWRWQTWVTFALGALFVGVLESTYRLVRDKHTARLEITRVIVESATETIAGVFNPPKYAANYVKVGARAVGEVIEGCTPYLTRLCRKIEGQRAECELVDPIALIWASADGATELNIQPALTRHFDLLSVSSSNNRLGFCGGVAVPVKTEGFFSEPGLYVLTVAVHSRSGLASRAVDVEVAWGGTYYSVHAALVLTAA